MLDENWEIEGNCLCGVHPGYSGKGGMQEGLRERIMAPVKCPTARIDRNRYPRRVIGRSVVVFN